MHKNGRIGINKYTLYKVIPLLNSSLKLPKQSLEMPQNISTLLIKTHRKYKESRDQYRAILHFPPPRLQTASDPFISNQVPPTFCSCPYPASTTPTALILLFPLSTQCQNIKKYHNHVSAKGSGPV